MNDSFKYDIYIEYSWVDFLLLFTLNTPAASSQQHSRQTLYPHRRWWDWESPGFNRQSVFSVTHVPPHDRPEGEERPSLPKYVRMSGKSAFLSGLKTVDSLLSFTSTHSTSCIWPNSWYHDIGVHTTAITIKAHISLESFPEWFFSSWWKIKTFTANEKQSCCNEFENLKTSVRLE